MNLKLAVGLVAACSLALVGPTPLPQSRVENKVNRLERDLAALDRRVKQLETANRSNTGQPLKPTMNLLDGARQGDFLQVRLNLVWGADTELADPEGRTPLLLACEHKKLAMARFLLLNGADPKAKDKAGKTAMSWAREHEDRALIALLESYGAQ